MTRKSFDEWIEAARKALDAREFGRARECLTIAGEITMDIERPERIFDEHQRVSRTTRF